MEDPSELRPSGPRKTRHQRQFLRDVIEGLGQNPKTIPCKYLYDRRGSKLFDQICELPEYYLTATELEIMHRWSGDIARAVGPGVTLIEPGAGSSLKTRRLLDELERPVAYVPIDISGKYLMAVAEQLQRDYPHIAIQPLVGDFTQPLQLPATTDGPNKNVVYFPGSTIGNFTHADAAEMLCNLRRLAGSNGGVLLGYDLRKEPSIIHAAYNDNQGITAEFNLNLLRRINRKLEGNFHLDRFAHCASYDADKGRVEMRLVSRVDQSVQIDEHTFEFRAGEPIITEYCHKYDLDQMKRLSQQSGLSVVKTWTDPKQWFAVSYMSVVD